MGRVAVYFQSWSSKWTADSRQMDLATIDPKIDIVYLSFANPNSTYKAGQNTFAGTGLDFNQDFGVVRGAIGLLKTRGVTVMLAVGGATYQFNPVSSVDPVCDLAYDLGCDGIDIDWEPTAGAKADQEFPVLIANYRKALWPAAKLSAAVFSTGAYGKDTDHYKGMNIKGLVQNGKDLDWLNLMAYDAGPPPPKGTYDPLGAFTAYRLYYPGPIYFGFQPGPMGWGGHLIQTDEIRKNADFVLNENPQNGIFIWSYQKPTTGSPSVADIINLIDDMDKSPGSPVSIPSLPSQPEVIIEVPSLFSIECPFCKTLIKTTLT